MSSFVPLSINFLDFEALQKLVMGNMTWSITGGILVLVFMLTVASRGGRPIIWLLGGIIVLAGILDIIAAPKEFLALLKTETLKNPVVIKDFLFNNLSAALAWVLLILGGANLAYLGGNSPLMWGLLSIPLPGITLVILLFMPALSPGGSDEGTAPQPQAAEEVHLNNNQMEQIEQIIARNAEEFDAPVPPCESCGSNNTVLLLKQEDPNHRQWQYTCSDGSPNFAYGSNTARIVVAAGYACKACGHQYFSGFQTDIKLNMEQ
ncbi:hypothetical protein GF324_11455 [bacterium]|nr:hypothetical protein [bacterium]